MKTKTPTQTESIKRHLERKGSINALEALDHYGCFRLAARINDLKNEGMDIQANKVRTSNGATISRYYIEDETQATLEL